METVLKGQDLVSRSVRHNQLQRQSFVHRHDVVGREWREGGCLGTIRKAKPYAHAAVRRRSEFLQFPGLYTRKSVLAHALALAEPRKNYWNAAANRLALFE